MVNNSPHLSILLTVEFYAPHIGGSEIVIQQISERLVKRGHRVEVATTKLPERTFYELNGVHIKDFDVHGNFAGGFRGADIQRYQDFLLDHPADVVMNYAAQQWATDLAFTVLETTKDRRVNVIAPCGYSALLDSHTLRWPEFTDYFHHMIPAVIPLYDAAVYHSSVYKDYEFAELHGFKNSIVIPNGVDEEEFTKEPAIDFRKKYGITKPFMGLCVANFYGGKGHDRVIECVRQMKRSDFVLVFIGKEGDQLDSLKRQAAGLPIEFLVNILREETVAAFHSADLFLFGSYIEASPLVIIEAKASKTPFVSTDCGNVKEWKGGIVTAPDQMAGHANTVLDDGPLRKKLAYEGYREWKERLTWTAVVDRYEELYLRLRHAKKSAGKGFQPPLSVSSAVAAGVIFSKDRPLQLDATLRSLFLHCQDTNLVNLKVLYTTSSALQEELYQQLLREHQTVEFVKEQDFKEDVVRLLTGNDYVLFLVDDNIFVRDFRLSEVLDSLRQNPDALGFSLRLGKNTTYCYPVNKEQGLPEFQALGNKNILKYNWPDAELDFGYPLEVSSSIYRVTEILPFISDLPFKNPNTLEGQMAGHMDRFRGERPFLLCHETTVTFCAPLNKVQTVYTENRASERTEYTIENLAELFRDGHRIDVSAYHGFLPNACHQEVDLKLPARSQEAQKDQPLVSVIIPCYKQAEYLPEAVASVVMQTYQNWECIIVNDGSPDNTSEVARKLVARYPFKKIVLLEKENGGLPDARNFGIKSSQGTYWMPLDADDRIAPAFMEKTVGILEAKPDVGFVYSHIQHFGINQGLYFVPEFDADTLVHTDNTASVCSLVRRSVWEEVGGYNADMKEGYEDWDFWIGCVGKGWRGYRIPEALFHYRKKMDSMLQTATGKRDQLISRIILNHPELYHERRRDQAEQILRGKHPSGVYQKVLIACKNFWPYEDYKGDIAENLGNRLVRLGYMVDIATPGHPDRRFPLYRGMNIKSINAPDPMSFLIELKNMIISGVYSACIVISDPLDLLILSLDTEFPKNTKIIAQPVFDYRSYQQWQNKSDFRTPIAEILRTASSIVTGDRSGAVIDYLQEENITCTYLPLAVEMPDESFNFRQNYAIPENDFAALCIMTPQEIKDRREIIKSLCSESDNMRLIVADFPSAEPEILDSVRQELRGNPNVLYLPGLSGNSIAAALRGSDVTVFFGQCSETVSFIPELMALGKPWISSADSGSARHYAGGISAEREKIRPLLSFLKDHPEIRNALGSSGHAHWETCFSWPVVLNGWEELIETGRVTRSFDMPEDIAAEMEAVKTQIGNYLSAGTPPVSSPGTAGQSSDKTMHPGLTAAPQQHPDQTGDPLVSVVVPCYNQAEFLPEAVESLFLQTFQDWECIIVNDGSPDNTSEVAKGLIEKYPSKNILLLEKENGGLADARNYGIRHAKGRYILPLDADDMLLPEFLGKTVDLLDSHPGLAIAYTDTIRFGKVSNTYHTGDYDFSRLLHGNLLNYCSLFRREIWEAAGGYNTNMLHGYEDWDFWLSCGEKGFYGKRIPAYLFMYRIKDNSMLTKAYEHDSELKARIVLNHPDCFDQRAKDLARKMLGQLSAETSADLSRSPEKTAVVHHAPKSILFVVHSFPEQRLGGTELYTFHLAKNLQGQGFGVQILHHENDKDCPHGDITEHVYEGIPVVKMNLDPITDFTQLFRNDHAADALGKYLATTGTDLVHFQNLMGFSGAALRVCSERGLPVMLNLHDLWLLCDQYHYLDADGNYCSGGPESPEKCARCFLGRHQDLGLQHLYNYFLKAFSERIQSLRDSLRWIDTLIVPSRFLYDQLQRHGFIHPNTVVLPFGILPFDPLPPHPPEGMVRLVFLGNIFYTKGLDILVQAMNLLNTSNLQLNIHGKILNQPYYDEVMRLSLKPQCIQYHGPYRPEDLPEILSHADAAVVPSRSENYPFVVRECLHAGVPVIASNRGGIPEIIRNGENGLLFDPDNISDLAARLAFLIQNPNQIAHFRSRIQPVRTILEDVGQMTALYQQAIERKT